MSALTRCTWAGDDPVYQQYHDEEWGVPLHDDRCLFEMLNLKGAQAGLSWITIRKKREGYRQVFDNINAESVEHHSRMRSIRTTNHRPIQP